MGNERHIQRYQFGRYVLLQWPISGLLPAERTGHQSPAHHEVDAFSTQLQRWICFYPGTFQ